MADTRVQVAKDKVDLLRLLKEGNETNAPFLSYADILIFAAIIGARHNKRVKINSISWEGLAPIPQDQFQDKEIIRLLSVYATADFRLLRNEDDLDRARIKIFQEYANGGLEIIAQQMIGAVDYTDQFMLMLTSRT